MSKRSATLALITVHAQAAFDHIVAECDRRGRPDDKPDHRQFMLAYRLGFSDGATATPGLRWAIRTHQAEQPESSDERLSEARAERAAAERKKDGR